MRLGTKTWMHIRRSPYQATAAILTMFLTFLLGGLVFLASASSLLILQFFESKPQITVFFTDKATVDDAKTLERTLEATGKVSSMKYVSKDQALAIYREQNKNDPLLLEMVTADILPASLEVSAKDPGLLSELDPVIRKAQGVEEVVFQKDIIDTLLSWTTTIRVVGGSLAGLLALDSLLIIMTVVSMKIALKKEEVEILKLIGASPWYIRMPFVLEGGFYGALGACMAWAIITGLIIWLQPMALSFLGMIPEIGIVLGSITSVPFLLAVGGLLGAMLISGFTLGSVGSMVALGRYLKF